MTAGWALLLLLGGVRMELAGQAPAVATEPAATRAAALLAAARLAAGVAPTQPRPRTLTAAGKSKRFVAYVAVKSPTRIEDRQRELSGRFEFQFSSPDQFRLWRKGETLGGFGFRIEEVVNGATAWRNPPLTVRSFSQDPRVIDVGDVERTLAMQSQTARQQVSLQALALLGLTPASYGLEWRETTDFTHQGETFDAATAATPDGLSLMLLFDRRTKLLTGLATTYYDTFQEVVLAEVASVDRRFIAATYARVREERRRRRHPRQRQQVVWRFTDHRPVAGVVIPHRSSVFFNGRLIEENTVTSVRIDEPIDPRRFVGEEKVKY